MSEVSNNLLEASYKFHTGQEVDNGVIHGTIKRVGLNSIFVQKADGTVIKVAKKDVREGNIFNHFVASIEKHILKLEEKKALAVAQQKDAVIKMDEAKKQMDDLMNGGNYTDSSELQGYDKTLYAQYSCDYSKNKHVKNRASMAEYGYLSTLLDEYLSLGKFNNFVG